MKCEFPNGMIIKPDGIHELSPHAFEIVEKYQNVTIEILRCKECGEVSVLWFKQEDTEELEVE